MMPNTPALTTATACSNALTGVGDMDGDQYDDFVLTQGNTLHLFVGNDDFRPGEGRPDQTLDLADAMETPSPSAEELQVLRCQVDPEEVFLGRTS